jgi:hypothetical protein
MINANDQLREYTCTDNYYTYLGGLLITDGVKALADRFECYWFLDIIASYQPQLMEEEFQVWTLKKNEDDSAAVSCTEGDDRVLKIQLISWTDFKPTTVTVWVECSVALLPSEH